MLNKDNQHDQLLYYTKNIGFSNVERIQVDLGFALSIILRRLLYFLDIPLIKLSTMMTTIYGFNAGSRHPLDKTHLRCQIKDLKTWVICYVINADTSYNLLIGRPWIHANWIILSALHQCLKYVDDKAIVRTVFAETQPFERVKIYFTYSLLYKENSKVTKEQLPDDIDCGNEAYPESEEDTPSTFAMEILLAYLDDIYCDNTVENDGDEYSMKTSILINLAFWWYTKLRQN